MQKSKVKSRRVPATKSRAFHVGAKKYHRGTDRPAWRPSTKAGRAADRALAALKKEENASDVIPLLIEKHLPGGLAAAVRDVIARERAVQGEHDFRVVVEGPAGLKETVKGVYADKEPPLTSASGARGGARVDKADRSRIASALNRLEGAVLATDTNADRIAGRLSHLDAEFAKVTAAPQPGDAPMADVVAAIHRWCDRLESVNVRLSLTGNLLEEVL